MQQIRRNWMRCRDTARRQRFLGVAPGVGRRRRALVSIAVSGVDQPLVLDLLQVGELRAALRDAAFVAAKLAEADTATPCGPVDDEPPVDETVEPPVVRQVVIGVAQ